MQMRLVWIASLPGETPGKTMTKMREIKKHESSAVSRQYTHLTTDELRAAMRRLPDVTDP